MFQRKCGDGPDSVIEAVTDWPRGEVFPRVLFVVNHEIPQFIEPRRRLIAEQIAQLPLAYQVLFEVTTMVEAVDHLTA